MLGRIPSAVGYQPTLATDMGTMQERITTTRKGSITSVQVKYYNTFSVEPNKKQAVRLAFAFFYTAKNQTLFTVVNTVVQHCYAWFTLVVESGIFSFWAWLFEARLA